MRHLNLLLTVGSILLLGGCASEWIHATKGPDQFDRDYIACDRQVSNQSAMSAITMNQSVTNRAIDQCLRRAGWYRKDEL